MTPLSQMPDALVSLQLVQIESLTIVVSDGTRLSQLSPVRFFSWVYKLNHKVGQLGLHRFR